MSALRKRRDETEWQYRSRVSRLRQEARDRAEPIVPVEAQRHAEYVDEDVMHVETGTRAPTKRRKSISSLVRMHQTGKLDNVQYEAALRIARVAEHIERSVAVRCASLEARVDCSGAARDPLLERLALVRDEVAYTRWRRLLPLPRRMILDMVLVDRPLATTARIHGKRWESRGRVKGAREIFTDALDLWIELRERVGKEVDESDLLTVHARLSRAA